MAYKKIIFIFFLLLSINLICLFALAQGVGYIQIKCEPGATVSLDNNFIGNTTSELGGLILHDVPAGLHEVKIVKEGYKPQSVKIDLKVNEIYLYEVSLKQKTGALLVETIPIDCIIEIPKLNIDKEHDGNKTKMTWEVSDIPIGRYRINFIALGKKVKYDLKIEEGTRKHLLVNILKNEVKELLPILTWDRTYGGSGYDVAWTLIQTTDGGYAVAGFTSSKGAGEEDFWVIKLDNQGNQVWDRTYGGSGYDIGFSLIQTTDGGYAVAGATTSKGAGTEYFWVIRKLDNQGNQVWDRTYGGSGYDEAYSLIQTTDGGYAVAGVTESKGAGKEDAWVIKLDEQGNRVWDRTYGGSADDGANSLIQTTDGGYAVAGWTDSKGAGNRDAWVSKLDNQGNQVWDKTYGGSGNDVAWTLIQTTDGGYAVAGFTSSKGAGGLDFWVIKLDNQGNRVWDKTYGGSGYDIAHSLIQTTDGGYAVAGVTKSKGAVVGDFRVIKLDNQGNRVWDRKYGGSVDDSSYSLIQTTDGGYAVAGVTSSKGAGADDFWVIKLDEQGNLISGVEDSEAVVEVKDADKNFDVNDYKAQTETEANTTSIQTITVPIFDSYQWEVGIPGFVKPGEITKFKDTTISTVQPSSPSNGATLPPGEITFSWSPVNNTTKYQFILYNSQGQVALDTIYSSALAIVSLGTEETITWKVRAGDNSGNWGAWSSTCRLTLKSTTTISTDSSLQDSDTTCNEDKIEKEITFKTFNYKDDYAEYSAKYPDWPNIPEAEFSHIGLKKFLNVGYSKEVSVNMIISQDFDLMDLFKFLREVPEDLEKEAMKRGKTIEFYMGSTQIIKDEKTDNGNFMELLLDLDGEFFKKDKEDIDAFLNSSKIHVLFKDFYCKENNKYFSAAVIVIEDKWLKYQNIAKSIINSMKVIKIADSSPQISETAYFLTGSLHCTNTRGYPCNSCSSAPGYINHFKGFNVLTTNDDCYVKLTYNDGDYIGNQSNCEVTIKGEKWLGLEDESGTKLAEEINSKRFNFKPANNFVERTMNFPGDNYKYEFANEGKEFRLYLSRNRKEAFKAVPWYNIVVEIKNKETNKVFKYKFQKGIFPQAYSWSNGGVANYGQCVWWAAKRWVEEVSSKTLFPFYPPSPQAVNVKKIDSNYQPQKYDVLINYNPGGPPEHYGFVEKVKGDKVYITQFNFMPPGEVYNHVLRTWKGKATDLYYSNNPNKKYYFKYYFRK